MKIKEILNEGKSVADLNINYKGGDLDISFLGLNSLVGIPNEIDGDFNCSDNKLTTLEGGPGIVHGTYDCDHNKLISLKGAPEQVRGYFSCINCELTSLKYAPKIIKGSLFFPKNKLSTFKNIFEYIHEIDGLFDCYRNPVKEGLLHILLIKGVKEISTPFNSIDDIINEYLKTNKSGTPKAMFDVQKLIIEAKLKDVPESVYME